MWVSLLSQLLKNLPALQETWVQFLGWENPREKGKATHSSILAWRIPWTVAHQAPLSIGFFRQEYWSGLPFPSPGDLPDPGIKPVSLMSPALAGGFFTTSMVMHGDAGKMVQFMKRQIVSNRGEKRKYL